MYEDEDLRDIRASMERLLQEEGDLMRSPPEVGSGDFNGNPPEGPELFNRLVAEINQDNSKMAVDDDDGDEDDEEEDEEGEEEEDEDDEEEEEEEEGEESCNGSPGEEGHSNNSQLNEEWHSGKKELSKMNFIYFSSSFY